MNPKATLLLMLRTTEPFGRGFFMMVLRQAGLIMVNFHCIIGYLDHGACDWLGLKPHICSRTAQQVEGMQATRTITLLELSVTRSWTSIEKRPEVGCARLQPLIMNLGMLSRRQKRNLGLKVKVSSDKPLLERSHPISFLVPCAGARPTVGFHASKFLGKPLASTLLTGPTIRIARPTSCPRPTSPHSNPVHSAARPMVSPSSIPLSSGLSPAPATCAALFLFR